MTREELYKLAETVTSHIDVITDDNHIGGSGYFNLTQAEADDGTEITSFFEVYKHWNYYGVYSCVDISGGANICDAAWECTESCTLNELTDILYDLANTTYTKEKLINMYQEKIGE